MHEAEMFGYLGAAVLVFIFYAVVIKCVTYCSNQINPQTLSFDQESTRPSGPPSALRDIIISSGTAGTQQLPVPGGGIQKEGLGLGQCSICLSDVKDGELCWQLPVCSHRFHGQCIRKWLKKNRSCPICRASVHGV